jgi:REP element-mobilizing transposase RayT
VRRRASLRLQGFDYASELAYFVTVCTADRACTLGEVVNERVLLTASGEVVRRQLDALPARLCITLDSFVVMPNHVHAIVALHGARQASPLRLGTVVGSFKSGSSREAGRQLWQRGYHDHVIRDEADLGRLCAYIESNPIRWGLDPENPVA